MRYLDDFSDYDGIAEYWATQEDGPEAMHEYLHALDQWLTVMEEQESSTLLDDLEEMDLSEDSDLF